MNHLQYLYTYVHLIVVSEGHLRQSPLSSRLARGNLPSEKQLLHELLSIEVITLLSGKEVLEDLLSCLEAEVCSQEVATSLSARVAKEKGLKMT